MKEFQEKFLKKIIGVISEKTHGTHEGILLAMHEWFFIRIYGEHSERANCRNNVIFMEEFNNGISDETHKNLSKEMNGRFFEEIRKWFSKWFFEEFSKELM